jgi:hypothetical protein
MGTTTQSYIKTNNSSGATKSDVQALVDAHNQLVARLIALCAKLDADAFGDTDYEATINGTAPNNLTVLSAIE